MRIPEKTEFDEYDQVTNIVESPRKLFPLMKEKFGEEQLKESIRKRTEDITVYLALANFRKSIPLNQLPNSLALDIKTFWGSYVSAREYSKQELLKIGNPDLIQKLCLTCEIGQQVENGLILHTSLVESLDPILRIYVETAGLLYGDVLSADLVKIHHRSGKATFLEYNDFENCIFPELHYRTKVNLATQKIDVFDHQSESNQQILYGKEDFVHPEDPRRLEWIMVSQKVLQLGIKPIAGFGQSKQKLEELANLAGVDLYQ